MSGLPPPPGHSPWPSLPPPVINHGREPDRNGDAPELVAAPAAPAAAPIERVVLPADESAATVVVVDPVSPIGKLEPGSVPRIAPSPEDSDEVGRVVITPVDAATPAADAAAASSPTARSKRAALGDPRWRRPLLLGIAALALIGILALLATLTRSNNDKTESIAATTTVVGTAPTTAATPASTVATTVPTTAVLPRTTSPTTVVPTTVATTVAPTTVAATAAPTTTEATAPAAAIPSPNIYDGRGNRTIKVAMPDSGPVLMYLTHAGKRNFVVNVLNAKGKQLFNAVNNIGAFTGSVLVDDVASLQITADGAWHVELRSVLSARQFANTVAGSGPEVLIYTGAAGTATILHDGKKDFRVEARTAAGASELVKTTGAFNGTAPMPAGFAIVAITGDGAWNVTVG